MLKKEEIALGKATTLKDIALRTGYSVITVSKALRDHGDISLQTREYIKQVADEMGYIKNASATNLRYGATHNLALIISDITNPFFGILTRYVEKFAKKNGYTVMIMNTDEDPAKEESAAITAVATNVDGVLIVPCQENDQALKILADHDVPYVLLARFFEGKKDPAVVFDDYAGGYLAAAHLLDRGYKRILMLNAEPYISSSQERQRGFLHAHKDRGIEPDGRLCICCGSTTEKCETALLDSKELGYDAILTYNDILAFQTIALLQKQGLRVPEEMAVVGFDDIAASIGYLYPLTSVSLPLDILGRTALEKLLDIIHKRPTQTHTVLPVGLNVRETSPKVEQK